MERLISISRVCFMLAAIFWWHASAYAQDNTDNPLPVITKSDTPLPVLTEKAPNVLFQSDITYDPPKDLQSDLPQMQSLEQKTKKTRKPLFDLGFLGPVLQMAFYGLLAFIVGYILYMIASSMVIARRNQVKDRMEDEVPDIPSYRPDAKTARILLDDADKLAAQGKFEEAVHLLLYRSIQDIERRRPHQVKRSLTAREIAGLQILTDKAKQSFALIGQMVEHSFFGGRPLVADDYEISKAAYKAFAFEKVNK